MQFELCVEPGVFLKVFDGCKRAATSSSQEPGELPEPGDTKTVQLDRDDMVRVFGVVSFKFSTCKCACHFHQHGYMQSPDMLCS